MTDHAVELSVDLAAAGHSHHRGRHHSLRTAVLARSGGRVLCLADRSQPKASSPTPTPVAMGRPVCGVGPADAAYLTDGDAYPCGVSMRDAIASALINRHGGVQYLLINCPNTSFSGNCLDSLLVRDGMSA